MSNVKTVAHQLVDLCRAGKNLEAINTLYADHVVSVEAAATPGYDQVVTGKSAVLAKAEFWGRNTVLHSSEVTGPFPHGNDRFAVIFKMDATMKPMNRRQTLEEIAVYQLENGKIVREEFFFSMGQ